MLLENLRQNKLLYKVIYKVGRLRARNITKQIKKYIPDDARVLDIGAGICTVSEALNGLNINVLPLDIKDVSFVKGMEPLIYNGDRIPFEDNRFDCALLLMVLHHTLNPEKIVEEAMRVSKRIIIIEDVYTSTFQKYTTYIIDSLMNLEFFGHPHSNKTDGEWKVLFQRLGLKLTDVAYYRNIFAGYAIKHATYCVDKQK